jgi:hypothetical protein
MAKQPPSCVRETGHDKRGEIRMKLFEALAAGLAGGAAGTTALNAVTYLDMAVRGRPASSTPEEAVEKLAGKVGAEVPGGQQSRQNRLAGLGPLTGVATGLGVGAVFGLARTLGFRPSALVGGVAAMAATDTAMAALDVSDPSAWSATDWLSDAVPHLAYGLVTAALIERLDRRY